MTPFSLISGQNFSEERTASIFRVEVCRVGNRLGYIWQVSRKVITQIDGKRRVDRTLSDRTYLLCMYVLKERLSSF
jgi:hypothetical protein